MDYYHLRAGWRNQQHESDHHYPSSSSAKIPKFLLLEQPLLHQEASDSSSALPLFVPEPIINNKTTNLSVLSDSTTSHSRGNMIGLFSLAQWQELELQALIFKYMLAGAPVPSQLLQHIKKNLFNTSPPPPPYYQLYNHPLQHYHHYQPAMLQSGYWERTAVDPEPGRCRRTDGKKWRCSRDVVTGQKYCERHMHRGRNRSRKPVEIPSRPSPTTVTIASAGSGGDVALNSTTTTTSRPPLVASLPNTAMNIGNQHYVLDGPSSSPSMNLLQLNQRYQEKETRNNHDHSLNESRSDNQVLRHFFDDWPKSGTSTNNVNEPVSSTSLSISIEGGAGSDHRQTFPDFSLKLTQEDTEGGERAQLNWPGMSSRRGGPLAEALQSSTSNSSSPTSTLPPLHGFGSESSSVLTK